MDSCHEVEVFLQCEGTRDESAWARFVQCFDGPIRRTLSRTLTRAGAHRLRFDLDDLSQEVYCRLIERRRVRFRGASRGEVFGYLRRTCESVVVDRLRSRRAAKRGGGQVLVSIEDSPPNVTEHALVDLSASPESELLARESRRRLLRSCRSVHEGEHLERDLEIFELAVLEGWTSREIAAGYDLKVSSIDSVVHRQRRRLEARGVAVPRR